MGQKVNPHGLRVGIIKDWDSKWYAEGDFADFLVEDYDIRKFLKKKLYSAGVSRIEIERASDRVKVIIYTAKPGVVIGKGGAVPESIYNSPAKIPTVQCPSLDDGTIILTDPKNLIVVNTYSMQIRKTTEGKEAIMQDKRFYVVHLDFDPIIEELDAAAIITGLK